MRRVALGVAVELALALRSRKFVIRAREMIYADNRLGIYMAGVDFDRAFGVRCKRKVVV
jgi:hypothetical protein